MKNNNWVKYIVSFTTVFLLRLLPFRAPNLEPIMAFQMPLSKTYGKIASFLFGALSITVYDLVTSGLGVWTLVTAIVYGLIGVFASSYFKNRSGWKSYASYAVFATIAYDALTGLTIGPLFFGQSFIASLVGQVPFTILHLLGNVSFAILLSPVIEKWFLKKEVAVLSSREVVA